ncbi:mechanosensitive ion channel family protein [Henriciella aquimarina]|uniref:mechanosensitive ion channel family protein n=1 Tax=Henriciella aquimarina TaxID=545261 RepID=UPI0009FD2F42|nr:mechanosensitive ion channel domain-containing protein [Henriciella aquimarina]
MYRSCLPLLRCFLVLCLAGLVHAGALAQPVTKPQTQAAITDLKQELSGLQAEVDETASLLEGEVGEKELNRAIIRIDEIWTELQSVENSADGIRQRAIDSIDAVTPLLKTGKDSGEQASGAEGGEAQPVPSGDPALEAVLAPLRQTRSQASVLVAEARLAQIDAQRLSLELASIRDQARVSSALDQGPSPLQASVWQTALPRMSTAMNDIATSLANWRKARLAEGKPTPFVILGLAGAFAIAVLLIVNNRFYNWQVRRFSEKSPTRQAVASAAMTSFLLRLGLALVAVGFMAGVAEAIGALDTMPTSVSITLGLVTIAVISARALVESVMAPRTTAFRLIAIGDTGARAACFAFVSLVFVFAIASIFEATGTMTSPGPELLAAGTFLLSLLTAGLLFWLALKLKPQSDVGSTWLRRLMRLLIAALGLFILGASMAGYSTLSRTLVEQIVMVSFILLIAILARELLRATALKVLSGVVERRRFVSAREDDQPPQESHSAIEGEFWVRLLVDTVMIIIVPPFLLLAFGMPAQELVNEIRRLIAGVEVGGQQISLGRILSALLTLAAVLLATRLIQRALEKSILPHTQISSGASNSLITLLGYAGVLVAGIAAISVIGFDLSSLAIIAGALSVGIGFGLQSIVSNFVAGLILLFERPFKIGDWIVTPSGEGTVRKINVRATEVETFDRQSVIVPNAELVSSSFGNWTHKSEVMRVTVAVGVKYGTDTRLVEKLLLEAAETVEKVRSYPPAYVVFKGFGDSSLNFELRGYIIADDIVTAPSELRHTIAAIFTREDVTIPFPQRDLHVDWPKGLRESKGRTDKDEAGES